MSSSDRRHSALFRRAALAAMLAAGGCGFTPVYAPGGAALALRNSVDVVASDTPFDYRLRTALEDRLGQTTSPVFTLTVETEVDEIEAAITPDGSITRFNLPGEAAWVLSDAVTGAELATGAVDSFTGYSTTGTTVATRTAEQDALDRLAITLADLIVARLIVASQDL
jgi:LPS-assembly lipoprotein